MRTLTLIIPDLLQTLAQADEAGQAFPLLRQITQAEQESCAPYLDETTAFYRSLGQKDDLPRATLLAHHYKLPPAQAWIIAEPIECFADKHTIHCLGSAHLDINHSEANQFIESLNQYLVSAGMRLYAPEPNLWLLALPTGFTETTGPLVLNRTIGPTPSLFTELQMLLHKHPVNKVRESDGKPIVHACWLSGQGALPVLKKQPSMGVITDNPLTRVLADWIEAQIFPSQSTLEATLTHYADQVTEMVICLNAEQHAIALEQNDMKFLLKNEMLKTLKHIRVYGGENICYDVPRKKRLLPV